MKHLTFVSKNPPCLQVGVCQATMPQGTMLHHVVDLMERTQLEFHIPKTLRECLPANCLNQCPVQINEQDFLVF